VFCFDPTFAFAEVGSTMCGGEHLETHGKVLRIEDSKVLVEVKRKSACSGECKDCSGCEARPIITSAVADTSVLPGQWVLLSSDHSAVLLGMFAVFILPLILPLAVYLITMQSQFALLFAGIALCIAIILIWFLKKSKWFLARTMPRVIKILPEEKYK